MLGQRQGGHLLVLEQIRRLELNGFGLAPAANTTVSCWSTS
jgi:hypothetical protein